MKQALTALIILGLVLSACGVKGSLKRPSDIKEKSEQSMRAPAASR